MQQYNEGTVVEFKSKVYTIEKVCLADGKYPLSYDLKPLLDNDDATRVTYKELNGYGKILLSIPDTPNERKSTSVMDTLAVNKQLEVKKRLKIIQPILRFNREKAMGTLSNSYINDYPTLFP